MTIERTPGWRGLLLVAAALLVSLALPASALAAEPTGATVDIPVRRLVSGDVPEADDTCTLTLTALGGAPMPDGGASGTKAVRITGEGSASFGRIAYTELGEYHYTISEVKGSNQRYSYDGTVYSADVQVTWRDEPGGEMVATLYLAKEDGIYKQEEALFADTYTMPTPVTVDPPVRKVVDGSPLVAGTFTFRLAADDAADPMPDGSAGGVRTFSCVGAGQAEAGTITFTEPGDYGYTVSEVDGGASGYSYDKTVYTMEVRVTEADGRLWQTTRYARDDGTTVPAMGFTNTFRGSAFPWTGDANGLAPWSAPLAALAVAVVAAAAWKRRHADTHSS